MLELFRKYLSLRPPPVKHKRLFCHYKARKIQLKAKNTKGKFPILVASYLKLPDVACYTGHCLRRSSATLLANGGVDNTAIKRHAGWKPTGVCLRALTEIFGISVNAEDMSRTPLKIRLKLLIRF
ncbi:hypothetical protein NQ317_017010 [Molorchus minor]|uniref:Tyr recombinase domain-containing protein n=1 Tax=Molorchus minor TaxID=1323400 RepID=A0ABQ9IS04_9CUCU|nr:hypothetical protein NQ317_017010 [Molorchus minor]